tara:strand:+ start:1355 stop:1678 length:324 start_codon:yes stop_codon:yes gene_type:complete
MEDELKEIVTSLLENGEGGVYEAHGEDGGVILNALQSAPYGGHVEKLDYVALGNYDFVLSTVKGLFSHHLHVFTYGIYKFIILESQDEDLDHGGSCDYASVHMFLKK